MPVTQAQAKRAAPINGPASPCSAWVPPVSAGSSPQDNFLLAALADADVKRWSHRLECVDMPFGQVLGESGCSFEHVYFPTTSIVSLLSLTSNGARAEVASIGNDGVVGMPLLMGGMSSIGRAVVQSGGEGYRLTSELLTDEFNRGGAVMHLLLRYSQALLTQIAQTAVCYRHHAVEQQLCRVILSTLDRTQGRLLPMTQILLAGTLGVRRESVAMAAAALQRDGLIRNRRGCVEVLDRAGLENRACECYGVVKRECDRLRLLAKQ